MQRHINKVAVLGSGVMGSRIACHFAGIGVQVLLLDIAPRELNEVEKAKNLTLDSPAVKNRIVNDALQAAIKSNPSPVFTKDVIKLIKTGNFTDDMKRIADVDWIIEVVVENLDVKKTVFEQVEKFRKPGTLITSNTSGIPIHLMTEGRSQDFQQHFCGTHFFNPPRYLRLLEIIPTPLTNPAVTNFLMHYGDRYLGKTTVLCKDTPAFIANRVGVFSIMAVFHIMGEMGLSIDDIDALTGPVIGHPKSATFRTADVVGIDTLVKVANGVVENCPNDEAISIFKIPAFLQQVVENKWLGDKTGQGFYKKTKGEGGSKEILTLNLQTMEYGPKQKPKFGSIEAAKPIEDLKQRLRALAAATDKAGQFYQQFHAHLFSYVSHRIPEIADDLYKVDDAMKAGFGWEIGPFETWDLLGVEASVKLLEEKGLTVAQWVKDMLAKGIKSFYQVENGKKLYYDVASQSYKSVPGEGEFIILENFSNNIIWKNSSSSLIDIGDGVVCFDWKTKMNTLGGDVLEGLNKAVDRAEKDFRGLVVGNDGTNFSAGANVGMIFMLAAEQEYDELDMAVRMFQRTTMRLRYSSIPVVIAPHGLTLGGGCEMCLHADKVQAAAETYIGLVELGVGIIPGGGGTKEMALRASLEFKEGRIEEEPLKDYFMTVATAKVATSGFEGFDMGVLRKGHDEITMNASRLIADAKRSVLVLADEGYTQPVERTDIKVMGRSALGALLVGVYSMRLGNYISEHDQKVANKLAYVMCGGDLTEPAFVSEQYLLDLEREAFLSLCGERKTLERLQSVIKTGRPVRN
ncbi:3-hydroxyacyl-CoA dehydrogenase/enoyl-CoA hydratase family protein [Chitinophaga nivalis]|uniref:3-hydroxyacyl-CoA dehydrogenase NAD-binding domain-containing protein n=1 Tax=Chitinophaga nivalis TaxID=2991709 RepID=A0ABT3IT24_9BACT|nr:3-hydroxyacyl-CoA dehydrogenase/enoyl-CoA hydratase family protein [Chitinophaga nivalis]MCW3463216.1 3-hydroxyacyl-CoA dehydrogenase NAD-binding domain-containing protein [Chitinophaga nivalis]MCW3487094.1 3-hydroxyacyl-CoA dehydrogenase NAD-binding domain-containing protein [Chitinophaga nivalis]